MKKWLICLMILALSLTPALAEEEAVPALSRQGLALGEGWVYYPQVEGMADEALQQRVNEALLSSLDVQSLLTRLALTMQSPVPLRADYTACLAGDVLSVALEVSGPVMDERATHQWRTANIDLRTGEAFALDDLFTDALSARDWLCDELEWELAPSLSAHLRNSQLTPLPEGFTLSDSGLTLHYDIGQLCTLGDRAGTVHIRWSRLRTWLNPAGYRCGGPARARGRAAHDNPGQGKPGVHPAGGGRRLAARNPLRAGRGRAGVDRPLWPADRPRPV